MKELKEVTGEEVIKALGQKIVNALAALDEADPALPKVMEQALEFCKYTQAKLVLKNAPISSAKPEVAAWKKVAKEHEEMEKLDPLSRPSQPLTKVS